VVYEAFQRQIGLVVDRRGVEMLDEAPPECDIEHLATTTDAEDGEAGPSGCRHGEELELVQLIVGLRHRVLGLAERPGMWVDAPWQEQSVRGTHEILNR
jgi:hypothetical protein